MNLRDIHTPVLLDRCVELLAPALGRDGAVFVDATEGMGGHSEAILERFPGARLIGLDRDTDALRIAAARRGRSRLRVCAGRAAGHADGSDGWIDGGRHRGQLRRG